MLEILIMGGDNSHHLTVVELLQYGLGYGASHLGFSAASHLIDQDKRFSTTTRQEEFHVLQVTAVGTQIVFDTLLVTDVDKDVSEKPHVRVISHGGQQSALHHILHHTHGLEAHRLAAGIRTRYD